MSKKRKTPCIWRGDKVGCCQYLCHAYNGALCSVDDANHPHYCGACSKREEPEQAPKIVPYVAPVFEQTTYAPVRGRFFDEAPWTGPNTVKPWDFDVTVAIPVLDSAKSVEAIVKLYRLQTNAKCYFVLIDTGSTEEQLKSLLAMQATDCEVHSLRLNGVRHPSDFPAIAMDLAFSCCRTPRLLATHADCFPMRADLVSEMLRICDEYRPVVGYELTERPHSDWRGMVGHTLTMFHMNTMDRINGYWSLRRLVANYPHPDGIRADWTISPATSPNWPDTELLLNYQLRAANITPVIFGTEKNAQRTVDANIDHCRSWASARLYSAGSKYHEDSSTWLDDGVSKAEERAREWSKVQ